MRKLKSFKHYPLDDAEKEIDGGMDEMYEVTTINWTIATNKKGEKDYDMVHKNIYHFKLVDLIQWIRDTEEVAEDIVSIRKMD